MTAAKLADTSDPRFTDDQRATLARFEAAVTPPEIVEAEQLADVIARFHDVAEPSPWMYDLAAAVAAYRAALDGGAEAVSGIDWTGLSWRKLRGWFRGTQCLARCDSMHRGGRWCLL